MKRWGPVAAAVLVVGLSISATGSRAMAATSLVDARDDFFFASVVHIDVGGSVTWHNRGYATHNVVADEGSFRSPDLERDGEFTRAFSSAGIYHYYCSFHGGPGGKGMSGIVVAGSPPGAPGAYAKNPTRTTPNYPPPRPAGGKIIHVPADASTIQGAVDGAHPGDMVLVSSGIYQEAVKVTIPGITIRGESRNHVILEGGFSLSDGIAVLGADGVAIENMTARDYVLDGFYWRSVWGYRGSWLTAYDNGDYGIYAFDSGVGMFDHSFASGSPDAGFYIGQCHPCNAVITDVVSKGNALGYSGTNAGGNLVLTNSEWTDNIAGIAPNTLDSELLPPQRGVTIVNNWIHSNHNHAAPARKDTYPSFGNGIILAGGSDDEVAYNLVEDHPYTGIAVTPNIDRNVWVPANDRVHDNTVGGSGVADLAMLAPASSGNCFSGNSYHTSLPPFVENFYGCSSVFTHIGGGDVALMSFALGYFARSNMGFPSGDYRAGPAPPSQPNMPGPDDAAPAPAGPSTAVEPATYLAVARQLRELASADLGLKRAFPALPAQARPAVAGGEAAIRLKAPSSDYAYSFFLALVGYLLPILFIAGLLLRISRRGTPAARAGLARTRVLIGLPVAYVAFLALVAFTGYAGYTG